MFGKKWWHTFDYKFEEPIYGHNEIEYRVRLSGKIIAKSIGDALKKLSKRTNSDKKLKSNMIEKSLRIVVEWSGNSVRK